MASLYAHARGHLHSGRKQIEFRRHLTCHRIFGSLTRLCLLFWRFAVLLFLPLHHQDMSTLLRLQMHLLDAFCGHLNFCLYDASQAVTAHACRLFAIEFVTSFAFVDPRFLMLLPWQCAGIVSPFLKVQSCAEFCEKKFKHPGGEKN